MITLNTIRSCNPLRVASKHSTLVVMVAAWLTAGTALADPPANDGFATALNLTGAGSGQTGDTIVGTQTGTSTAEATVEDGEPNTGASNTVWFKWTCPAKGNLTVSTLGSTTPVPEEWDAILGIYTGATLDALTPLGTTPQDIVIQESMTVAVNAGTTYFIQLSGYESTEAANILLSWKLIPTNGAAILTFGPDAFIGRLF